MPTIPGLVIAIASATASVAFCIFSLLSVIKVGSMAVVPYFACPSTICRKACGLCSWLNKAPPPPFTCKSIKPALTRPFSSLSTCHLLSVRSCSACDRSAIILPLSTCISISLWICSPSNSCLAKYVFMCCLILFASLYLNLLVHLG